MRNYTQRNKFMQRGSYSCKGKRTDPNVNSIQMLGIHTPQHPIFIFLKVPSPAK